MQGNLKYIFGTKDAGKTLTDGYVAATYTVDVAGYDMLTAYVSFVPGVNANVLSLLPQFSIDGGSTWYSDGYTLAGTPAAGAVATSLSLVTYTLIGAATTGTYNVRMRIPVKENGTMNSYGGGVLFRFMVKETNGGAYGTAKIAVSLEGNITRG